MCDVCYYSRLVSTAPSLLLSCLWMFSVVGWMEFGGDWVDSVDDCILEWMELDTRIDIWMDLGSAEIRMKRYRVSPSFVAYGVGKKSGKDERYK